MSTDAIKDTACPNDSTNLPKTECDTDHCSFHDDGLCENSQKKHRSVSFPDDGQLVTQYFEPANPWQDAAEITRSQLVLEYLECCRKHCTHPMEAVLQQIRELPEGSLGVGRRCPQLCVSGHVVAADVEALEAVLSRARFRKVELRPEGPDDDAAEALFDMIEYYESAQVVSISGPRNFGIRGWQACSRMIKKSAELVELEISDNELEPSYCPVISRALKPVGCHLRSLNLHNAKLRHHNLACFLTALKSNTSVRDLRLGDNELKCEDAFLISSLLAVNNRINLLDLSNNQIQDAGVGFIVKALVSQSAETPSAATSPISPSNYPLLEGCDSKGLAVLVLWNNQLTRNCTNDITKVLSCRSSLAVLNVGRNAVGSAGATWAAVARLAALGLQAARITPQHAVSLAEALTKATLQRLDLRDNKLGVEGLQALVNAMKTNKTITQIDFDDPKETTHLTEDSESSTTSRLCLELAALCRKNESVCPVSVARRISLSAPPMARQSTLPSSSTSSDRISPGEDHKVRLRSPLPSPASSPTPALHSRFSVTPVAKSGVSSPVSKGASPPPTKTSSSPSPSRFTVVQVAEPPKIKVTSDRPKSTTSRFSVTRNYDSMYDTPFTPSPSPSPVPMEKVENESTRRDVLKESTNLSSDIVQNKTNTVSDIEVKNKDTIDTVQKSNKLAIDVNNSLINYQVNVDSVCNINDVKCVPIDICVKNIDSKVINDEFKSDSNKPVVSVCKWIKNDEIKDERVLNANVEMITDTALCDNKNDNTTSEKLDVIKKYSDVIKVFEDETEQLSHDETVSIVGNNDEMSRTEETKVKSKNENLDVQVQVVVRKEILQSNLIDNTPAKHYDQSVCNVNIDTNSNDKNIAINLERKDEQAIKLIEAITQDISNTVDKIIDIPAKPVLPTIEVNIRNDFTLNDSVVSPLDTFNDVPVNFIRNSSVVLKKNKSESSLDSPDLEVSRLMNKKASGSPFFDSSSSLEISGSSMESLNAIDNHNTPQISTKSVVIQESLDSDSELDRRKLDSILLSKYSSMESTTSDATPVNSGNFLNMSLSSNESVSPIIFGKNKKIHGSLSSLEASCSSLDSGKQEKVMVTSADSGIEYSLQNPPENRDDNSSNEGTLTHNTNLKDSVKKNIQETITSSPKRIASLLDVPETKVKGMDRVRKISWVAPSTSFQFKPEPEKVESKLPSHLEKLLSLFQNPTSLFSRTAPCEDEKKSVSSTPPRKDSSFGNPFWSWGSLAVEEKVEKTDDKESPPDASDSTLSERVQISFVDDSFSKKLDSKTSSTDSDNTLSEFQSPIQGNSEICDLSQTDNENKLLKVTDVTTDDNLVQKKIVLSIDNASSNDNKNVSERASDNIDLIKPNDLNKNVYDIPHCQADDNNKNTGLCMPKAINKNELKCLAVKLDKIKPADNIVKPKSFAVVLKSSGSENSLDKQTSPDKGFPVDDLPNKVIREIKENISPENTLTSSVIITKDLAIELTEKQAIKIQPIVNTVWESENSISKNIENVTCDLKMNVDLAPIATIEEICDDAIAHDDLKFIDDVKDEKNNSNLIENKSMAPSIINEKILDTISTPEVSRVDLGKDALSYLLFDTQAFIPETSKTVDTNKQPDSLAQELKDAEIKEKLLDCSPELVVDNVNAEVFAPKETLSLHVIPEKAKLKKSNSFEDVSKIIESTKDSPKQKTIVFNVPEATTTSPRDIPARRPKLRSKSGSSPKSLPDNISRPCSLSKADSILIKKKKKVSSLGKIAKDSLLALNMSEEEIAEFRRSYKLNSRESLRSLESVSEDANSHSGTSYDSRCRSCLRMSQESLMSLDSITEDCHCTSDSDKGSHSAR